MYFISGGYNINIQHRWEYYLPCYVPCIHHVFLLSYWYTNKCTSNRVYNASHAMYLYIPQYHICILISVLHIGWIQIHKYNMQRTLNNIYHAMYLVSTTYSSYHIIILINVLHIGWIQHGNTTLAMLCSCISPSIIYVY